MLVIMLQNAEAIDYQKCKDDILCISEYVISYMKHIFIRSTIDINGDEKYPRKSLLPMQWKVKMENGIVMTQGLQ